MKRWFVAKLYEDPEEGRVPAVHRYTQDYRIWSNPTSDLCVGQCAFRNLGPLQADKDIQLFPDAMLMDFRWDSIGAAARNAVTNKAAQFGFATAGIGPNAVCRDVLHSFVHQLQPGISIESGDVFDRWG